jgi:hypothetical protein
MTSALVAAMFLQAGQTGPWYEKLYAASGTHTQMTMSCCCGTGAYYFQGELERMKRGQVDCTFELLHVDPSFLEKTRFLEKTCAVASMTGESRTFKKVNERQWVSAPMTFQAPSGYECQYLSIIYLVLSKSKYQYDSSEHWEYRESRSYTFDASGCAKRLPDDTRLCRKMEQGCSEEAKQLSDIHFIHDDAREIVEVNCTRVTFGGAVPWK